MPRKPRLGVTREAESGRNLGFVNNRTGEQITRAQFVKKIEQGAYDDYYVRKVNGVETPATNPDKNENANLGWGPLRRLEPLYGDLALMLAGLSKIIGGLEPDPELRVGPARFFQANGHVRRYPRCAV